MGLIADPETEPLERGAGGGPPDGPGSSRLRILALWDDQHLTFPLPESGTVTVGRAQEGVDLRIGDGTISRQHVRFHVGEKLRLEDLRSANGTSVRGRRLDPGETVEVNPGDMIELGRTMLVIQRTPSAARPVQIYTHDYFEARVDGECSRAERGSVGFAIVRVHDAASSARQVEERLAASVRPGDVLASYGPCEHELLWVDCSPEVAEQRRAALLASLQAISPSASVGLACSPRDGRVSALLLEKANAAVQGRVRGDATVEVAFHEGPMENLRRIVERVAGSSINVLITGETGVGKGVLAAELHRRSPRSKGPFVAINCAELSESLLEAELFGYERGAYTGAVGNKPGLIETADGGTLLLDEIGEMLLSTQAKMLKVLEDRRVRRLGALHPRPVDLRLVTCTNRDLEAEIERKTFRQDLYFRIAVISLVVPPLRERVGEIEELARGFAAEAARARDKDSTVVPVLSSEALEALRRDPWPGNVRELRNVIERAVLLCTDDVIRPEHLKVGRQRTVVYPPASLPPAARPPGPGQGGGGDKDQRQEIIDALAACAGNQRRAAELLGISLRKLVYLLDKFGLPRPRKKKK
jgi:DNA-binding NtrC family response regulator